MSETTTNFVDNTTPDQFGHSKPLWFELDKLVEAQWCEPADVEEIGPCDADLEWWAENSPKDDEPVVGIEAELGVTSNLVDDPAVRESDLDHLDEMEDALAMDPEYQAWLETLENRSLSRPTPPLTDKDIMRNTGAMG